MDHYISAKQTITINKDLVSPENNKVVNRLSETLGDFENKIKKIGTYTSPPTKKCTEDWGLFSE